MNNLKKKIDNKNTKPVHIKEAPKPDLALDSKSYNRPCYSAQDAESGIEPESYVMNPNGKNFKEESHGDITAKIKNQASKHGRHIYFHCLEE